jgi:hypothetical protein
MNKASAATGTGTGGTTETMLARDDLHFLTGDLLD